MTVLELEQARVAEVGKRQVGQTQPKQLKPQNMSWLHLLSTAPAGRVGTPIDKSGNCTPAADTAVSRRSRPARIGANTKAGDLGRRAIAVAAESTLA